MSVGIQFLFSILGGDPTDNASAFSTAKEAGIDEDYFDTQEEADSWRLIETYFSRYGVLPSVDLVELETGIRFPSYVSTDPFVFWLDQLRRHNLAATIAAGVGQLMDCMESGEISGAIACIEQVHTKIKALSESKKTSFTYQNTLELVVSEHERLQRGLSDPGIPIGFPYVDEITGGAQKGDSWVVVGRISTGKSYLLCRAAKAAHEQYGKRVLFVTMEMLAYQMARRQASLGAGINSTNLRLGRLSHFGIRQLQEYIDDYRNQFDPTSFVYLEGCLDMSIERIQDKISEFNPDIVFIDGAYLLQPFKKVHGQDWQVQMAIMESIKRMAMDNRIPIISSYQFKRGGEKEGLDGIARTDAIAQLASIVLGINPINDQETTAEGMFKPSVSYRELEILKGREGERGKIRIRQETNSGSLEQESIISGVSEFMSSGNHSEYDDFSNSDLHS